MGRRAAAEFIGRSPLSPLPALAASWLPGPAHAPSFMTQRPAFSCHTRPSGACRSRGSPTGWGALRLPLATDLPGEPCCTSRGQRAFLRDPPPWSGEFDTSTTCPSSFLSSTTRQSTPRPRSHCHVTEHGPGPSFASFAGVARAAQAAARRAARAALGRCACRRAARWRLVGRRGLF